MPVTLTSPLTHVKDEVRGVVVVTTLLMLVKDEVKYEHYTFSTLLNGVKGDSKYMYALNYFYGLNTHVESDKRKLNSCNTVLRKLKLQYRTWLVITVTAVL